MQFNAVPETKTARYTEHNAPDSRFVAAIFILESLSQASVTEERGKEIRRILERMSATFPYYPQEHTKHPENPSQTFLGWRTSSPLYLALTVVALLAVGGFRSDRRL